MERASVIGVTLFIFFAIGVSGDGNLSTQNRAGSRRTPDVGAAPCNRSMLCCKLGRKAVRLSYPTMYTCNIEALSRGLEHHTSTSHRLKHRTPIHTQAGRMDAANSLHMSLGFRRRLMLCKTKDPSQKRCFEDCCRRKLRGDRAKVKKIAEKQDTSERGKK